MAQDLPSECILYQLLREWLSRREPDLLAAFERDPQGTAPRLRAFLERAGAALPPTLATHISGGRVEKLVYIAQAGVVHIQAAKAESTLTPEQKRELERRYLERVAEECRYLETEGVDRAPAELTDVFVMLEAVESPRREIESDIAPVPERTEEMGLKERAAAFFERRKEEREERALPPSQVPFSQALGAYTHLVILGEPGTGKTTTLKFVALCFATDGWAKSRLDLDEARVPVRVALREYDGAERLDRFIIRWLDRAYVREPLAQAWLAEGRLAVLLDGLDEVPQARRAAVAEAIERLAATPEGRRCRILVTSRIAGYREGRSLGDDFGQYTIRPFAGPEDAQPYATAWLEALKSLTREAAKEEAKTLLEAMEKQGGLRRVMSNPLLLHLAVAIYVETGELACSRAELYRSYVEEVTWKQAEALEEPCWSYSKIAQALEILAWKLQTQGEQTAATLAEAVEDNVANVADGRNLLNYLRERLGLLAIYGYQRGDLIAFRHLTFQEYFVARSLARAWDANPERAWRFLRLRLHHPAWQEPFLLLGGMLVKTKATDLVHRVLQARSPYERELHRDLLLAAAVLGDGAPVVTDVAYRVTNRLTRLYLDVKVKWWHRLILPMSIWLLLTAGIYRNGPVPRCLVPLVTFNWWGVWMLSVAGVFPRLQVILSLPHRLSGRCAYSSLQTRVENGLVRLPEPQQAQAVELLIAALEHNRSKGRLWAAAMMLGKIGDPRAVGPLIRALEDQSVVVRWQAVEALAKIGDPRAVKPLIRMLGDEHWWVRVVAAVELGQIGDPRAVGPLIRTLEDENRGVRGAAAGMLGKIGDPQAVEPLIRALGDEEPNVRGEAVEALGVIGDPRAVEPLIRALGDEERNVRGAAVEALGVIDDPRAVEPLIRALGDEERGVRVEAEEMLGKVGDLQTVECLIRALGDKDRRVRQAAVEALGKIGEPAVEPLIWALRHKNESVRRAAVEALGTIGDPRAVAPLIRMLRDEHEGVRREAAMALGEIGEPAVEPLIRALMGKNGDVRGAAVEALNWMGDETKNRRTARKLARSLWCRLTDIEDVADDAYRALARVVARLTELEVTALGSEPSPFAPASVEARPSLALPIVLSVLLAALSGLASNILAAYLQSRYRLITDASRLRLVVAVFVLTLVASIGVALRREKRITETAGRE